MAAQRPPGSRTLDALASPGLANLIGLVGIITPAVAWATKTPDLKNILLAAETGIVLLLVGSHIWRSKRFITLPKANNLTAMDDAAFYERVRVQVERDLVQDYEEIANGHMRVYASDVPRLSVMLVKTLIDAQSQPQRILAADLTTNPTLLTRRREYLNANRQMIDSGGQIQRLFIANRDDLTREAYARDLLALINQHRQIGVTAGLAIRDRLRAEEAVDYIVFASAAVLVEEEQGDADYNHGRSSVHFQGVDRWAQRFDTVWGTGAHAAPQTLQTYETAVRPMLDGGTWDSNRVQQTLDAA
ncbi:hypothetical protein [Streptomyces lunalinharesii]|uniref:Uncharacterized protein n=1 Tax=Streptomyces lunalinharesii TaxID=333384 RepID=A0ABN3SXX6_9ACTN